MCLLDVYDVVMNYIGYLQLNMESDLYNYQILLEKIQFLFVSSY